MRDPAPFILTLLLDAASQSCFDELRSRHFPADRLHVGAHVTLFHALPNGLPTEDLEELASTTTAFPISVTGVRFLGRGVAFTLMSTTLNRIRHHLRERVENDLSAQDRAHWQPHVTIQNKAAPAIARALYHDLSIRFSAFSVTAAGLGLWRYRGGPWEAAGKFYFRG